MTELAHYLIAAALCLAAAWAVPDRKPAPIVLAGRYTTESYRVLIWKDSDGKHHAEWRTADGIAHYQGLWTALDAETWVESYDPDMKPSRPIEWRVKGRDPLTFIGGGWKLIRD